MKKHQKSSGYRNPHPRNQFLGFQTGSGQETVSQTDVAAQNSP